MIKNSVEDNIFKNLKEYLVDELEMSEQEYTDFIESPHFSEAMSIFFRDIASSPLYQEMYGEMTEESLVKDDKYGYCEISMSFHNEIAKHSHEVSFDMSHLYRPSEYSDLDDDDELLEDIGEFKKYHGDLARCSNVVKDIYYAIVESNKNDDYINTMLNIPTIEDLLEIAEYKFYIQNTNPFIGNKKESSCSGLNYMNTNGSIYDQDTCHKAVALESPVGTLAYLHFKASIDDEGNEVENSYYVSSVGVVPSLRRKGISKEMYELSNSELGFNDETIIFRSSPGRLAPKQFTENLSEIVKNHKAVYLDNALSRYDFSKIENFKSIHRKEQVKLLKTLNKDYYDTLKAKDPENPYSITNELRYDEEKDFLNKFKEKVEKVYQKENKKQNRSNYLSS